MVLENKNDLENILGNIPEQTILVVGDIILDRFVNGVVNRISRESPVPVLLLRNESFMLGGAGNVVSNLDSLKAKVKLVTVTGDDHDGNVLEKLLSEKNVGSEYLVKDKDKHTTIKTRYMASHQQLLRADFEDSKEVSKDIEDAIVNNVEAAVEDTSAVIISDYGNGVLTDRVIKKTIRIAGKFGVPVFIDPRRTDFGIFKNADYVTPNKLELCEAAGNVELKTDEDFVSAAQQLIKKSGIKTILATRSADGMTLVSKNKTPVHIRTKAKEVYDVSGAGDTVIATFAAAIAAGADPTAATQLANMAGGVVVGKIGTAPIRLEELKKEVDELSDAAPQIIQSADNMIIDSSLMAPFCSWEEAAELMRRWKARGLKVGFTNGCFDILHKGHVTYLAQAKSHCDRLVLALNADTSVSRLKGPTRPVNSQDSRALVMGGLSSIDMVVLFGENESEDDKAIEVISMLQPDIYFKGGDYTEDQIPEAPTVRAYGGETKVMSIVEGFSTTNTIQLMKKEA